VLRGARSEGQPEGHPLQDKQCNRELKGCKNHQQRQQLTEGRIGLPAAEEKIVPPDESARSPRRPGEDREQRDQRPVKRNVVVRIADRCRDRDYLAVRPRLGRGDRGADFFMVSFGQLRHHDPDAPPPPKEPPPPEKPPPPPPQPPPMLPPPPHELPREPRLSSLRPQ